MRLAYASLLIGGNQTLPLVSMQRRIDLRWKVHAAGQVLEARGAAQQVCHEAREILLPPRIGCLLR